MLKRALVVPFVTSIALPCALPGFALSCKEESAYHDNPPPPPPPSATARGGACLSGGGTDDDAISAPFFPRTVEGYCLDPKGGVKTYGEKGKLTMDDVCTSALDGECEVYKRFDLVRMVALRYVDGGAGGGSVEVYLSQFKDASGAYAMFTKRVVADGDPADPSAPRPLAAGAAGAMGTGRAYVWKGAYLAELQYNNEEESPDELAKTSARVLAAVGKQIGDRLPGSDGKPAAAERLPTANLVPNGISYLTKDALDVRGAGAAAIGYYKDGDKRWRQIAFAADGQAAKDVMSAFRSRAGSLPVSDVGADEAVHAVVQASKDAPKTEWLLARKGAAVIGVGDDEIALKSAGPQGEAGARLKKEDAVAKVKAWVAALAAAPSAASASAAPAGAKKP